MTDELLTANEAAALLKVHLKTLYKLTHEGKIPATRVGKLWRYSRNHILCLPSVKYNAANHFSADVFAADMEGQP